VRGPLAMARSRVSRRGVPSARCGVSEPAAMNSARRLWRHPGHTACGAWARSGLAAILLALSAAAAAACPLCYDAARRMVTIGQELDLADRAVLALPIDGENRLRVVAVVKGEDKVGDILQDDPLEETAAPGDRVPLPGAAVLLMRMRSAPRWTSRGAI